MRLVRSGSIQRKAVVATAVLGLVLGACTAGGVPQDDFDEVQSELDEVQSELEAALERANELDAPAQDAEAPDDMPRQDGEAPPEVDPTPVDESEWPFGIPVEEFDASGPPAYDAAPGTTLAFVQTGISYNSPATANMITVLNAETREVLAQVEVPLPEGYATHGMGISADGRWLYLPSLTGASSLFHIIDASTLKIAKTLEVGGPQHHVDEGTWKSGDFVLVDTYAPHGGILLDPQEDNEVIGKIPVSTFFGHYYSGWSAPDGSFAYFTVRPHIRSQNGWLSKVDLETGEEVSTLEVGHGPIWVAFSEDGGTAWVSNGEEGSISRIDVGLEEEESDELVTTLDLDAWETYGLVLNADSTKLYVVKKYVANADGERVPGASVVVVDTVANEIVKEIEVGDQPDHVFLSPNGEEIWVGENRGYAFTIISTSTDEVTEVVEMPGDAHTVVFHEVP